MVLDKQPRKGDKITYEREIMFKGTEKTTSEVVAIAGNKMLLENGDETIFTVNSK